MTKKNFLTFLVISLVLIISSITLFAAYQSTISRSLPPSGVTHSIVLTETGFTPSKISINQADSIRFSTILNKPFWPASDLHPTHNIYPEFDSKKPISPQESWTFIFEKPGTWGFHDHLNPELTGEIIVISRDTSFLEKDNYIDWTYNSVINHYFWLGKINIYQLHALLTKDKLISKFEAKSIYQISDSKSDLEFWLATLGPTKIMEELVKTAGGGQKSQCHRQAHAIGRGAFAIYGIQAFKNGDASCSSGFYHGVMEAFVKNNRWSNPEESITDVCSNLETNLERIHCFHGTGHGILVYYNNDLPKAISFCETLSKDYGKAPCMTGVFMENIVIGTTNRYHSTEWLSFDPHFPCTIFTTQSFVLNQCYLMQTTWMTYIYQNDYERIFEECANAPEQAIAACYQSFGKDIGLYVFRDPEKILSYCNKLSTNKDYYQACIKGALYDILDFWGFKLQNQGNEFCNQVLTIGKGSCYKEIENRKNNLIKI